MISKWYEYKDRAINLRMKGVSIRKIEMKLGIPRSTLSGWFKGINLTEDQRVKLELEGKEGLKRARKNALIWHNRQKEIRLLNAKKDANNVLENIDPRDKNILELALSMLYLGEGSKTGQTAMGNSNPEIIKFFLNCLAILYGIQPTSLKYYLHLRSDHDENITKKFWSDQLNVPIEKFNFTKDKRTIKSKTYSSYHGVCVVYVGKIALLRRMSFITEGFFGRIVDNKDP